MRIDLTALMEAYSRIASIHHYQIFTIFVTLDIVTGYTKAFINKNLDSKIGLRGLAKHFSIVLLVFITCPYLWLLGAQWIALFLLYSLVVNYGISIVENYSEIAPGALPPVFRQFFKRLRDKAEGVTLEDIQDLEAFIKKEIAKCEQEREEGALNEDNEKTDCL